MELNDPASRAPAAAFRRVPPPHSPTSTNAKEQKPRRPAQTGLRTNERLIQRLPYTVGPDSRGAGGLPANCFHMPVEQQLVAHCAVDRFVRKVAPPGHGGIHVALVHVD